MTIPGDPFAYMYIYSVFVNEVEFALPYLVRWIFRSHASGHFSEPRFRRILRIYGSGEFSGFVPWGGTQIVVGTMILQNSRRRFSGTFRRNLRNHESGEVPGFMVQGLLRSCALGRHANRGWRHDSGETAGTINPEISTDSWFRAILGKHIHHAHIALLDIIVGSFRAYFIVYFARTTWVCFIFSLCDLCSYFVHVVYKLFNNCSCGLQLAHMLMWLIR